MAQLLSLKFDNLMHKSARKSTMVRKDDTGKILETEENSSSNEESITGTVQIDAGDLIALLLNLKKKAGK